MGLCTIQILPPDTETAAKQRRRIQRDQIDKDLKYKRSFFVRMVSDPKIYNPKIVAKSLTFEDSIAEGVGSQPTNNPGDPVIKNLPLQP